MRAQFTFHPERCLGCGACVMACVNEKGIDIDTMQPYRLMKQNEYYGDGREEIIWFVHGCMHCPEHPCVDACPKKCFSVDDMTGTVVLDNTECIGCHKCERVCAYGALQFRDRHADKCDGCRERLQMDMLPLCVLACPRQALTINEKNRVVKDGLAKLRNELEYNQKK
jgi:anaerobic dimethyl sulfoxide reductase subunit B (iron-sulfur subunit)